MGKYSCVTPPIMCCKKFSKLKKSRLKVFLFFPQGPIETYIHAIQYTSRQDEVYVPHNFGSRAFLGNRKAKETVYKKNKLLLKRWRQLLILRQICFYSNSQRPTHVLYNTPVDKTRSMYHITSGRGHSWEIEKPKKQSIKKNYAKKVEKKE